MVKMTKQEQRKHIAKVFAKINDDFSLAEACEQLHEEGIDEKLLFRKSKEIFGVWIRNYYFEPEKARDFMAVMQTFWNRGLDQKTTLDKIEEFIEDETFYFFLYKRGPRYGMKFDKVELGKHFLIDFTDYVHTHFQMLLEGFELSSDDILEIITDPTVVSIVGVNPDTYETILEDCLDSNCFEYDIDDIADRYVDVIGYSTAPIWLIEVMGRLIDNGASVIDIDNFAENVLFLKEKEGVNWSLADQDFYEDLLSKFGADYRLIEALVVENDRNHYDRLLVN